MRTAFTVLVVAAAVLAGHVASVGTGVGLADTPTTQGNAPVHAAAAGVPNRLVVHEWGTFTSFSGSSGISIGFAPNNADLPNFVYHHSGDPKKLSKAALLIGRHGTVSMETPVLYFYTDRATDVSAHVHFREGWITEWYPHAASSPEEEYQREPGWGESIRWDVKLLPGAAASFPREKDEHAYYRARETDAAALQTTFDLPKDESLAIAHGGSITQREKFLFYRGVGDFPPPVSVQALGGGKVRVTNASGGKATGLVLVTVRDGHVSFRAVNDLPTSAETVATLPDTHAASGELAAAVEKSLVAAGLYEREARAMVKTWERAWFAEEGTRLLYIVPRKKTDELLSLTVSPAPAEVVRVMVGRHDFLTPEAEAVAERQLQRIQWAQAELAAAEAEIAKLGRFAPQARQQAAERLAK